MNTFLRKKKQKKLVLPKIMVIKLGPYTALNIFFPTTFLKDSMLHLSFCFKGKINSYLLNIVLCKQFCSF